VSVSKYNTIISAIFYPLAILLFVPVVALLDGREAMLDNNYYLLPIHAIDELN
jgi:hypothetical protein